VKPTLIFLALQVRQPLDRPVTLTIFLFALSFASSVPSFPAKCCVRGEERGVKSEASTEPQPHVNEKGHVELVPFPLEELIRDPDWWKHELKYYAVEMRQWR
jgi:hypothetical protein